MSRLKKIQETKSLNDFAKLLGFKPSSVSYILYIIPESSKYLDLKIPKKSGGIRLIKAPTEKLKKLQRRLADLLNDCYDEINKKSERKVLSHGFVKRYSIISNAKNHKNKRYVFNVDIQDFFPSINFGRVRGFFIKNRHFNLNPNIATIIAQIACHNNELPQGSPCSPIISNLIGHLLDIRMVNLAKKAKCTYSRYADDLTFSTNKRDFPKLIAINQGNKWIAGDKLAEEIEKIGFHLNTNKTSMQFKDSRQITTGLIVNKKINIKREYYKTARSMCHELFNTGEFYFNDKDKLSAEINGEKKKGSMNQLEGILNFIYQIKRPYDNRKLGNRRFAPNAITKLYRFFLFYKHFHLMKMPVIICEGKTDVIYLKCALKQLSADYKEFIDTDGYKVKFLNISKNFRDVFAISTGTSGLKHLIEIFEKKTCAFNTEGKDFPVVIIIDNDAGSKEIKQKIKIKENEEVKDFYHIVENLYLLIIPKAKGKAIEDLFEPRILETEVDGKKFNRQETIDTDKEYGKIVFAVKVVKQQEINFDGFKEEVFDKLKKIIDDYCENKKH